MEAPKNYTVYFFESKCKVNFEVLRVKSSAGTPAFQRVRRRFVKVWIGSIKNSKSDSLRAALQSPIQKDLLVSVSTFDRRPFQTQNRTADFFFEIFAKRTNDPKSNFGIP